MSTPPTPTDSGEPLPPHIAEAADRALHALAGCTHQPACPPADAADRYRAHVVAAHPEQGWSLLCNGVIAFDDLGALLPGRRLIPAGPVTRVPAATR